MSLSWRTRGPPRASAASGRPARTRAPAPPPARPTPQPRATRPPAPPPSRSNGVRASRITLPIVAPASQVHAVGAPAVRRRVVRVVGVERRRRRAVVRLQGVGRQHGVAAQPKRLRAGAGGVPGHRRLARSMEPLADGACAWRCRCCQRPGVGAAIRIVGDRPFVFAGVAPVVERSRRRLPMAEASAGLVRWIGGTLRRGRRGALRPRPPFRRRAPRRLSVSQITIFSISVMVTVSGLRS